MVKIVFETSFRDIRNQTKKTQDKKAGTILRSNKFKPNVYTPIYNLKDPIKFDFFSFEQDIETTIILWHLN